MTFWYKRVFPIFWFGFLLLFMVAPWTLDRGPAQALPTMVFVVPVLLGIYGLFLMKKLVFDLVDEVLDDGDALVVRNRDMEERIALSNIVNVSYSQFVNPPRVTLLLRNPGLFGERVSFCAPTRFNPFSSSPMIDDLIRRIDAKRGRDASK
jgi:hypothetical protein